MPKKYPSDYRPSTPLTRQRVRASRARSRTPREGDSSPTRGRVAAPTVDGINAAGVAFREGLEKLAEPAQHGDKVGYWRVTERALAQILPYALAAYERAR